MQIVVFGQVAERGVIDGKHGSAYGCQFAGHHRVDLVYLGQQGFVVLAVYLLSAGVEAHKGVVHVFGDDTSILGRAPGMRVGIEVVMVIVTVVVAVLVSARENVDTLGVVEDFHVRIVLFQLVHPGQFKSDVPDFEVGNALAQMHEVRRRRVVSLGIAARRYDAVDVETIACDLLGKVLLRLYGYSDNLLFFVSGRARYGYECEQYTCTIFQK